VALPPPHSPIRRRAARPSVQHHAAPLAVNVDADEDVAGRLVLGECDGELRRQLHTFHGDEVRRPDVLVVVVLVVDGQPRGHGDGHVLVLRVRTNCLTQISVVEIE
jgi:hypothetical protein